MKIFLTLFLVASLAVVNPQSMANEDGAVLIKFGDALNDYWRVEKKVAPKYPSGAIEKRQQGCVTVGYFIEADGSTSGHRVIFSYPDKTFDRSAVKANKKFTYMPGALNQGGESVMTIYTFTYLLAKKDQKADKEVHEAISRQCKDAAIKVLEIEYGPLS